MDEQYQKQIVFWKPNMKRRKKGGMSSIKKNGRVKKRSVLSEELQKVIIIIKVTPNK